VKVMLAEPKSRRGRFEMLPADMLGFSPMQVGLMELRLPCVLLTGRCAPCCMLHACCSTSTLAAARSTPPLAAPTLPGAQARPPQPHLKTLTAHPHCTPSFPPSFTPSSPLIAQAAKLDYLDPMKLHMAGEAGVSTNCQPQMH